MAGSSVEDMFAMLGLHVKESEWRTGDKVIDNARKQMLRLQVQAQQRADRAQQQAMRSVKSIERQEAAEMRRAQREQAAAMRAVRSAQRQDEQEQKRYERQAQQTARVKEREAAKSQKATERAAQNELKSWQRAAAFRKREEEKKAEDRAKLMQRTERQAQFGTAIIGGLAAYFGKSAIQTGIQFNKSMEGSKNQVAGMLALTKKTHLTDELSNANMLVDNLSRRAAALPGTTAEYVHMLGMITKPIMDAKLSMQDLEDLTVNSVVAAKAFGIAADVAARDVDQALRGQYHSVDPFSGKILGGLGYNGEEGRRRFNQMSAAKRASEFKRGLMQPQIAELGEAQGKGFEGVMSTLEDAWQRFMGAITLPVFEHLVELMKEINKWLDANKQMVAELAATLGGVLLTAFNVIVASVKFLLEHGDMVKAVLIAISVLWGIIAVKSMLALWPIYAIAAVVAVVAYGVIKLIKHWDSVKEAAKAAWGAIKDGLSAAFSYVWDSGPVRGLRSLVDAVGRLLGISGPRNEADIARRRGDLQSSGALPGGVIASAAEQRLIAAGALPGASFRIPGSAAAAGAGAGPTTTITGGVQISVNSPNADPGMVGNAVSKKFDEKMGNITRRAMDVVK